MKRAIVIGASSGIGMKVARQLLQQGWTLGVAARRVELLQSLGAAEVEQIDVTSDDATSRLRSLIDRLGGMDLFFYASGIGRQNHELHEDIELSTVTTNGLGFTRMVGEAYRYFAGQGGGHIAAITSIAGTKGLGPAPSYSATKAMQNVYLQALEQQACTRGLNIRFTDIRPGFVDTALLNGDFHYPMMLQPQKVAQEIVAAINRRQHIRVIDWRYRLLTALWRRIPRCLWRRIRLFCMMAILFAACTDKPGTAPTKSGIFDQTNLPAAEKLMMEAMNDYNSRRIVTLADSLEATGDISAVAANYYRGVAAVNRGMLKMSLRHLREATANSQPDTVDLRPYLKARALLARVLTTEQDYENALKEALPTLAMMDSLGNKDYVDMAQLYVVIGRCQQNLQMPAEASVSFTNAYTLLREWMVTDTLCTDMPRIILFLDLISTSYTQTSDYAKAKIWLDREDSALAVYTRKPGINERRVDDQKGTLSLELAEICQRLGWGNQAARHYDEYLKTAFSRLVSARIDACNYLMLAGRYAEAAENYTQLDALFQMLDLDLSLDNIGQYLLPKFKANVLAGNKDSAIAVSMQIIENFDSALIHQKEDVASELATIYDTQGKERRIAEQEMHLSRVRMIVLIVAFIAVTVFFVVFTIIRMLLSNPPSDSGLASNTRARKSTASRVGPCSSIPTD